jgi:hypothetical protein
MLIVCFEFSGFAWALTKILIFCQIRFSFCLTLSMPRTGFFAQQQIPVVTTSIFNSVSKNTFCLLILLFRFRDVFRDGRCVNVYVVICTIDLCKEKRFFVNTIVHQNS